MLQVGEGGAARQRAVWGLEMTWGTSPSSPPPTTTTSWTQSFRNSPVHLTRRSQETCRAPNPSWLLQGSVPSNHCLAVSPAWPSDFSSVSRLLASAWIRNFRSRWLFFLPVLCHDDNSGHLRFWGSCPQPSLERDKEILYMCVIYFFICSHFIAFKLKKKN